VNLVLDSSAAATVARVHVLLFPSSFSSTADSFSIAIFLLPTSPVLPLSLDRLFTPPDFSFPSPIFVHPSFPLRGDQLTCSAVDLQPKATNLRLGRPRSNSLRHFSLPDLFCYSRPAIPVWDFEVLFVPLGSYLLSIFQSAQLILLFGSSSCRSLARDILVSCLHISVSCLHISVSCLHILVSCLHISVSCLHISVSCLPISVSCYLFRFQFSYFSSAPSSDNSRLFPACAWLRFQFFVSARVRALSSFPHCLFLKSEQYLRRFLFSFVLVLITGRFWSL
jgi:hypothetical protein